MFLSYWVFGPTEDLFVFVLFFLTKGFTVITFNKKKNFKLCILNIKVAKVSIVCCFGCILSFLSASPSNWLWPSFITVIHWRNENIMKKDFFNIFFVFRTMNFVQQTELNDIEINLPIEMKFVLKILLTSMSGFRIIWEQFWGFLKRKISR